MTYKIITAPTGSVFLSIKLAEEFILLIILQSESPYEDERLISTFSYESIRTNRSLHINGITLLDNPFEV